MMIKKIIVFFMCGVAYASEPGGLQNLGNTCYINSTLQCLRALPELTLLVEQYKGNNELTLEYKDILKSSIPHSSYTPATFIGCVNKNSVMGDLALHNQQDASEFFKGLIEKLEPQQKIAKLCTISYITKKKSDNPCANLPDVPVDDVILRIGSQVIGDIKKEKGVAVETLIKKNFAQEVEEFVDYNFYNGEGIKKINVKEKNTLLTSPQVLAVTVPRFDGLGNKIKTPIFSNGKPLVLYEPEDPDGNKMMHEYALQGVVFHIGGSPKGGHYNAVVKYGSEYFNCDDTQINVITEDEFGLKMSGGYDKNMQTYMFFFRRIDSYKRFKAMPDGIPLD